MIVVGQLGDYKNVTARNSPKRADKFWKTKSADSFFIAATLSNWRH
jgi:hypothetical protein